ncbi:MAG: hypothetical protein WC291_10865, partial [Thermodesulfovibrionales bacterium]
MNKRLLIKNGHIVDPSQGLDGVGDILIENGKIAEIRSQKSEVRTQSTDTPPNPPLTKGGQGGVVPDQDV